MGLQWRQRVWGSTLCLISAAVFAWGYWFGGLADDGAFGIIAAMPAALGVGFVCGSFR